MRHAPPCFGRCHELQPIPERQLREHIKKPKAHNHLPLWGAAHRTRDQGLGIDGLPIGKLHGAVKTGDCGNMGLGWDFAKQACATQIGGNHPRDILGGISHIRRIRDKDGQGEGERLNHTFGDLNAQRPACTLGPCG